MTLPIFDPTVPKQERELLGDVVDLTLPDGRLNPAAVGWSRHPHIRARMRGWGRRKRFEYWAISTPELVFAFSVSHSDYRAGLAIYFLDLTTLQEVNDGEAHWFPGRVDLPESLDGEISRVGRHSEVAITPEEDGVLLSVSSERLSALIHVHRSAEHESMGVVVPWTSKRFQYTRKDNALRASGWVEVDGIRRPIRREDSWAALDQGRGKWPHNVLWNWGAGAGMTDGHEIGIQLGAKWTDGSPATENAIRIDGHLHKLSHDIEWVYDTNDFMREWTFHGPQIDLRFTPVHNRHSDTRKLFFRSREDQAFGHWNGWVTAPDGTGYRVENIFGWAEEVHRIW